MTMKQSVVILVVDDEAVIRGLLEKVLTRDGYTVLTANDGEMALGVLAEHKVDIVVSDIRMPNMDGLELLETMRQKYPIIPVMIMTAYGETFSVKDALLLGADEYIAKPFKIQEFSELVEKVYWRLLSRTQHPTLM